MAIVKGAGGIAEAHFTVNTVGGKTETAVADVSVITDSSGNEISFASPNNTARLTASAATTNAANVTQALTFMFGVQAINKAAYDVFVKIYDKASSPTVGTDTPKKTLVIPAGAAAAYDFPSGFKLANGLSYAITKLVADSDTTAIAANDVLALNIDYL